MIGAATHSKKHRWTLPEFRKAWDAGIWPEFPAMELIDGEVFFMPSDGFRTIDWNAALNEWLCRNPPQDFRVVPDKTLPVGDDGPKPDFWIYPIQLPLHKVTARETVLVIEVSDTTLSWDLGGKATRYALGGTPEYWVIDVAARCTHVFRLEAPGRFAAPVVVAKSETLTPVGLPSVTLRLTDLRVGPQE